MSNDELAELGWALASDGVAGHEAAVRDVVSRARRAGVSPVVAGVLADPRQPEAARLRAYGCIATRLAALDGRQPAATRHAA